MLLNNFFYIEKEETAGNQGDTFHVASQNTESKNSVGADDGMSAQYHIRLNPEHPIFKGHFPGCPITPGVCVVQIAVDLFSYLFKQEYHLHKAKNIKFLNIIKPDETDKLCYQLSWKKQENNEYRLKAMVQGDEITYAKMDITVETEN